MTTGWILDSRPLHPRYGEHMYYGLLYAVQYAQSKGYNICDLASSDAVKEKIYEKLDELDPIFFFGIGHGNKDIFTDDREQAVWRCGEASCPLPPDNLRNRIVYLWSCLTARELGPKIIEHGGWSYAGFKQIWVWLTEGEAVGDPYDDKYAKGFYESGNELIIALLNRKTIKDAVQASIDKYNEWIDYWKTSGDPHASECIKWLAWDRDALTLIGDPNAAISEILTVEQYSTFFADIYLFNSGNPQERDMMLAFGTYNEDNEEFTIEWKYIFDIIIPSDNGMATLSCIAEKVGTWDVLVAIGRYDPDTDTFYMEQSYVEKERLVVEKSI